jgi:hypothetical protein
MRRKELVMLKTTKSITVTGLSQIEIDGATVTAVRMTANIPSQATGTSENIVITNQEVYDANIRECRADIDEFRTQYRLIEDEEMEKLEV